MYGSNNEALLETFVVIWVSMLLQVLCERDLTFVSWMFAFIPLIFMTVNTMFFLFFAETQVDNNTNETPINNNGKRVRFAPEVVVQYLPSIPYGSSSPEYQS